MLALCAGNIYNYFDIRSSILGQTTGGISTEEGVRGATASLQGTQLQVPSSCRVEHAQGGVAVRECVGSTGQPGRGASIHCKVTGCTSTRPMSSSVLVQYVPIHTETAFISLC